MGGFTFCLMFYGYVYFMSSLSSDTETTFILILLSVLFAFVSVINNLLYA